jgi:TatD DNase family protein
MTLVDSHCHLFYPDLLEDIDRVMKFASQADVKYMLSVGTSVGNAAPNLELSRKYDNVFCSVGVHPDHTSETASVRKLLQHVDDKKVVAYGETGLDYFHSNENREEQKNLLREMLSLSEHKNLPYIIHARDWFTDVVYILDEFNSIRGVFHCYTGDVENTKKILDKGFYISFSGIITFKKSDNLRETVKYVPMDRMLIETDAPYLAPHPYRGKTNEPAYTSLVAEEVARTLGLELCEVADLTTKNFFTLFNKAERLENK